MKWIHVSQLPPIDESNEWNKTHQISKDVLCFSKNWGMRFGRYFHLSGRWSIDGVTSSNGVVVENWMEINPPKQK